MAGRPATRHTATPMTSSLPPWPIIDSQARKAVDRVLSSGRINRWRGGECSAFEVDFASWHSPPLMHAICMSSGTAALEAAARGIGIDSSCDVLCPARSFAATAMCIVRAQGVPVFADVDSVSGCVTVETLESARTPRTRAAIVVHLGGWPCDMPAIMEWAHRHDILIIEDCAQAHGASIDGRHVGTFGHAAAWSFCNDKILTTGGEGGMFAASDPDIWKRAWSFGEHGKDFDATMQSTPEADFQWLVKHEGTNLRMSEMQAVIGRCQLQNLDDWIAIRRRNMAILHSALDSIDCVRAPEPPSGHAGYRYTAYLRGECRDVASRRSQLIDAITQQGWPANSGSCPDIQREPFFQSLDVQTTKVPTAKTLGDSSIAFLTHPTIDEQTMRLYAEGIAEALTTATADALVPSS